MMYCPTLGLLRVAGGCELDPLVRPPGAGGAGRVAMLAEGGVVMRCVVDDGLFDGQAYWSS